MLTLYYSNGSKQVLRPSKAFHQGNVDQKCRDIAFDKRTNKYSLNKVLEMEPPKKEQVPHQNKYKMAELKRDFYKRQRTENPNFTKRNWKPSVTQKYIF